MSFPGSAYYMVMKALWLVLVLVKQPSLGVIVYVHVREKAHLRESAPAVVMFGLLVKNVVSICRG